MTLSVTQDGNFAFRFRDQLPAFQHLEKLVIRMSRRPADGLVPQKAADWFGRNPRLFLIQFFCKDIGWVALVGPEGVECLDISLDDLYEDEWLRYQADGHIPL